MVNVKKAIQYVNGYMIYCKAKKIRAQEEKREQRMKKIYQKIWGVPYPLASKSYPWSKLYHCRCGNRSPWMHGFGSCREAVTEGAIYRVVCHRCFRHTKKGTYQEVVEEWNTTKGINYKKVIADWEGYPYIEPSPLIKGPLVHDRLEQYQAELKAAEQLQDESDRISAVQTAEEKFNQWMDTYS